MGRKRTLNYRELRSYDEDDERRKDDEEGGDEDDEEEDDEDEEAAEAEDEDEEGDEGDEDDEEGRPRKPAKKPKPPPKPAKPKRSRAGKVVRLRVIWGVFNNSNQRVAAFDYNQRHEADEHAAKLSADKKQTFFVQPVKEPIEEKPAEAPEPPPSRRK